MSRIPHYLNGRFVSKYGEELAAKRGNPFETKPPRKVHKCAHPKCEQEIPMNLVACHEHWSELPLVVKLEVQEQYDKSKALGRFTTDYFNAVRRAKGFWKDVPQK